VRAFLSQNHTQLHRALECEPDDRDFAANGAGNGEPHGDKRRASACPHAPAPDSVLRTHDLEIDTRARTVTRGGCPVRLTPREYGLLEFLARHRGRVVSRALIWKNLYDEYDSGTSNVIDVYIRYLRRKLDRGREPSLIVTRRGEGYMLRADDA
jgi:DNA-binding response OmpR family regulator